MPPARFALRFLLPAEIIIGLITFSWGLTGATGSGRLTTILQLIGASNQWGWSLTIAGLLQAGIAALELQNGRDWTDCQLHRSADKRSVSALFTLIVWVVVLGMFLVHVQLRVSTAILTQAPMMIIANAIVCYHTKRLAVLLDPKTKTTQLHRKMVEARIIRS